MVTKEHLQKVSVFSREKELVEAPCDIYTQDQYENLPFNKIGLIDNSFWSEYFRKVSTNGDKVMDERKECSSSEACKIVEDILNGNDVATSSHLLSEGDNSLWLEQVLDYSLQGKKIKFKIFKWEFILYYKRKERSIWP